MSAVEDVRGEGRSGGTAVGGATGPCASQRFGPMMATFHRAAGDRRGALSKRYGV